MNKENKIMINILDSVIKAKEKELELLKKEVQRLVVEE